MTFFKFSRENNLKHFQHTFVAHKTPASIDVRVMALDFNWLEVAAAQYGLTTDHFAAGGHASITSMVRDRTPDAAEQSFCSEYTSRYNAVLRFTTRTMFVIRRQMITLSKGFIISRWTVQCLLRMPKIRLLFLTIKEQFTKTVQL